MNIKMKYLTRLAMKSTVIGAATAMLFACGGTDHYDDSAVAADTVFTNGKVVTVDEKASIAQAMAVKDGKFLAVGTSDQMLAHKGPNTKVIDLGGRTVIPGLTDSHLHTGGGGPGVDLSKVRSLAELFAKVTEAASVSEPGDVIVSNSDWHEAQLSEHRLPTAAELEAAAPGVPVVLVRGGHSYFLNNTALAKYGITPTTPVPVGGAIPQNPPGTLTGEITDTAKSLVTLPAKAPSTIKDLQAQQELLNSYGLTSVRMPGTSVNAYRQLQELRDTGKATLRYNILFRPKDLADFQTSIVNAGIQQGEGDEWVKVWGIKTAVDGGFEGGLMTRAYEGPLGKDGTYFGLQVMPQDVFNAYMVGVNQAGWRAAVHASGDAAVDQVLEGYEAANTIADITTKGWTIEHASVTRPDHYPRMKALNLRLSVQNHLYLAAPVLEGIWGIDRTSQHTPLKSILDEGLLVAGGTDSPVIPVSPFWVMYHFLSRDTISGGVYGKEQAVPSRDTMLRIMTINNAKLTDEQSIKGSIEPGKLADFVVLSADYMTIPMKEIEDLKALATYVGGEQVYKDPSVEL